MEIRRFLKKMLTDTSVFFTVITAIYALLMLVVNVSEDEVLLSVERILLNFMFAWLASLAQALLRQKRIPTAARVCLHYLILAVAFYTCFLLVADMTGGQVMIGLFAFTLVWGLVLGLGSLLLSRFRKLAEPEQDYQSQFKKNR